MSAIPYTIAALVISGAACTAGLATSKNAAAPDALVCELRLSESNRHVTIAATAQAIQAVKGSYQLDIAQNSTSGRAQIRQSGEFDLKAGEHATLGEATLSGRARDFSAELTVQANGQSKRCGAGAL